MLNYIWELEPLLCICFSKTHFQFLFLDKQSISFGVYLTSAAGGFHGCQRPSSDQIFLCNALVCYTPESKCSQVLGSTSSQFPQNPRNTGYLLDTNAGHYSDRQLIMTWLSLNCWILLGNDVLHNSNSISSHPSSATALANCFP